METPHNLAVGEAAFYAREQAIGIVYETYTFVDGPQTRPGVSLLLSNGHNVGGFSAWEADLFLMPLGDTGLNYHFSSVGQLAADYRRGLFSEAFHCAQVMHISKTLADTPPLREQLFSSYSFSL